MRAFPAKFSIRCVASEVLHGAALYVLEVETGKSLKHNVLCRHPCIGSARGTSYRIKLGCLCQGIGADPANHSKKHVKGNDTFHVLCYKDTPLTIANISISHGLFVMSHLRSPTQNALA